MELKGKVDSKKAEGIVKELSEGLEEKAKKELNVFKCVDHIKDMLLFGLYDEAVNMANIMYHENTLDPISENFTDVKSRKIAEIRYIIKNFKNKIKK
jgi:hypothetical protein